MSESEAKALLAARVGKPLCVSYSADASGRVRFRDPPRLALAGWALAVMLMVNGCIGFGRGSVTPPLATEESIDFVAITDSCDPADRALPLLAPDSEFGQIIVVVRNWENEQPIPGARVTVSWGESSFHGETDDQGIVGFDELTVGVYRTTVVAGTLGASTTVGVEPGGRSKVKFRVKYRPVRSESDPDDDSFGTLGDFEGADIDRTKEDPRSPPPYIPAAR